MSRPKKLAPIISNRLDSYRTNQNCSLPDLSKETGLSVEELLAHFEKNGGLQDNFAVPPEVARELAMPSSAPPSPEVAETVRASFARREGICIMNEGTSSLIQEIEKGRNTPKSNRSESSIFRGNKPAPKGNDPSPPRGVGY